MKENMGCIKSIAIYILFLGVIAVGALALTMWKEYNPVTFCDEIEQTKIKVYNPVICKLRYPILNTDEIKKITKENEELKEKVSELENRLDDLKDVLENGKEDNWEPDPPETDF